MIENNQQNSREMENALKALEQAKARVANERKKCVLLSVKSRDNIDMDSLMQRYPYEQKDVQEIYELIVETVAGKGGSMTISGQR